MRILPFLVAAGMAFTCSSFAQISSGTATTDPVGYVTVTITPAVDSSTPRGTTICNPLHSQPTFVGAITSVDGTNSFSCSTAAWTAGQFTSSPNLVRIKSGNHQGRSFLVSANSATQLTVNSLGYNLTAILSGTESFEVVPANTLATLFGASSSSSPAVAFQTSTSVSVADNIMVWNGVGFDTFYNNGTNWRKSGSVTNQNNAIIYPDEAIFVLRRSTSPLSLTFAGSIPTIPLRTDIYGPASTFTANQFPVDTTLLGSGINSLPGWLTSTSVSSADNVFMWNGVGWDTYYHNGTNWKKSGSVANQNTTVIPTGSGVFITRKSSATGTASTLVQALPYSL